MKNMLFLPLLILSLAAHAAPVVTKKLLDNLYQDVSGFGITEEEEAMMKQHDAASTYGEITYEGARQLLKELKLGRNDVFYDLGCGVGKLVMQVYHEAPVKKAVGIELCSTRAQKGKDIVAQLKQKPMKSIEIKEGNFLEVPLSDATVVFMCSTCFSDKLMRSVVAKLAKETRPGLKLVSLRELITPEKYGFKLVKTLELPMTWSENTPVNMYELQVPVAPAVK